LWDGAVPMTDAADGLPYAILPVPGRDIALQLLLDKTPEDVGEVVVLPYRVTGTNPDGSPTTEHFDSTILTKGDTRVSDELGITITLKDFSDYTLLIAKHDPGQGIVWLAFLSLIAGITITFYLPRRRVWTRLGSDGRLGVVWRSDRYVEVEREFGRLLDDFVAARRST
jgi:cytochrome c biogenesis protein ResB